ncbi:hypothetical protein quinque_008986 [Culex quinquefasciatus]
MGRQAENKHKFLNSSVNHTEPAVHKKQKGCVVHIASRFEKKKKNASVSPRPKTFAISVPRNGHPGTPALYVTDLKFKLKNTVPEFAGDGTVRYGCYLLAAASVVGYVFMETTAGQGDR